MIDTQVYKIVETFDVISKTYVCLCVIILFFFTQKDTII